MSESITSGKTLDKILNFFKDLSEKIFKFLSTSTDYKVEKVEKVNDNTNWLNIMYKDKVPVYVLLKALGDDLFDLEISVINKGENPQKHKRVKGKDFQDVINKACAEMLTEDDLKSYGVESTTKLQVMLQRVEGASGTDIQLTRIAANYAVPMALADLTNVLQSDEFCQAIPAEPTMYEVTTVGDEYDVSEAYCADTYNPYLEICQYLFAQHAKAMTAKVYCDYAKYAPLHTFSDMILYFINDMLRTFMNASRDQYSCIPALYCNTSDSSFMDCCICDASVDPAELYAKLCELGDAVAAAIDTFAVNLSPAEQAVVQRNILDYQQQREYYRS